MGHHNVLTSTISEALPDYGEPNIDHGRHCRISFGGLQQREDSKAQTSYGGEKDLYKSENAPKPAIQPVIQPTAKPWYKPTPKPVIYNPARPYESTYRARQPTYLNTANRYVQYPEAAHPKNSWLSSWGRIFGR